MERRLEGGLDEIDRVERWPHQRMLALVVLRELVVDVLPGRVQDRGTRSRSPSTNASKRHRNRRRP
jgi:hypothetical protein